MWCKCQHRTLTVSRNTIRDPLLPAHFHTMGTSAKLPRSTDTDTRSNSRFQTCPDPPATSFRAPANPI